MSSPPTTSVCAGEIDDASLIVSTDRFESSLSAIRRRPLLEIAAHLNRGHYGVIARIAGGSMRRDEIYREWRAQIAKARDAGVTIRQLNAHGHHAAASVAEHGFGGK